MLGIAGAIETQVAVRDPQAVTASDFMPLMTIEQAVQRKDGVNLFIKKVMIEGEDYGAIPGAGTKKVLLKPGAEKYKVVRGPTDAGVYATCMPTGVPLAYFVPYQWEIVQGIDKVVILYEYLHMFRVVSINGTHPADPDPTWMGDSIGHWDGDTLVVDSVGFNDRTELPGAYRHSEALHVVERFHRTDFDHLQWEATIEDPNVFAKPWTIARTFALRTDLDKVDEYVCENNKDYKDLFGK